MALVRLFVAIVAGAAVSVMAAPPTSSRDGDVDKLLGRYYMVQLYSKQLGFDDIIHCLYIDFYKDVKRPENVCATITVVGVEQMQPRCEEFNPATIGELTDIDGILDANGQILTITDGETVSVFSRQPVPLSDKVLDSLPGLQAVIPQFPETAKISSSVCAS